MVEIAIIASLCVLATAKVTVQGLFAKGNIKTTIDGIFFNGLIFAFAAALFVKDVFPFNLGVALFGATFGILSLIFQLTYIKAMSYGNVSLIVMVAALSMIVPTMFSAIVYSEPLTTTRIIGIALTILALACSVDRKEKSTNLKKWIIMAVLVFLSNSAAHICLKVFGKTELASQNKAFVAWGYIVATIFSAVIFLIFRARGTKLSFKISPKVFYLSLGAGLILGIFQVLNAYATATIDGTLLFPSYNGGVIILSGISGAVLLKDKLKPNQIISIFIGVAALIFMNI